MLNWKLGDPKKNYIWVLINTNNYILQMTMKIILYKYISDKYISMNIDHSYKLWHPWYPPPLGPNRIFDLPLTHLSSILENILNLLPITLRMSSSQNSNHNLGRITPLFFQVKRSLFGSKSIVHLCNTRLDGPHDHWWSNIANASTYKFIIKTNGTGNKKYAKK